MKFRYSNNLDKLSNCCPNITFRATNIVSTQPTKTTENQNTGRPIDTLIKKVEEEKEKKSSKKAIAVGSSIIGLATLVALFNPKNSSKLISKMKIWSGEAAKKIEQNKSNYLASKFHKATKSTFDWSIRTLQFCNNVNSVKDIWFTRFCCDKKNFHNIKNYKTRKILKKIDSGFVKIMGKTHRGITRFFDSISKSTVKRKYNKTLGQMNELEQFLLKHKDKLPTEQRAILETKLAEINSFKEYFSETNITQRLLEQEKLMSTLDRDVMKKFRSYRNGFSNKWVSNKEHIGENLNFWAEEILMPTRNKLERQGLDVVEKLTGNQAGKVGLYDDVLKIFDSHLSGKEKQELTKRVKGLKTKITKANHAECVEYFGKKRDLTLGSSPTDILTASIGLSASGLAIATADDKEQRISRTLTGAFPVIAGFGTNLVLTSMLFSGIQGVLMGAGTGIILSKIGSTIDEKVLGNTEEKSQKIKHKKSENSQEVKHV